MSKKVLILSGSPRKNGNSDILCDEFAKGATEAGHNVEKIHVSEKNIHPCIACYHCSKNSGACVFKDDMAEILQKMIDADVLVLASPVYFYSIDAQLKAVIDRTVARWLEVKNKEFYYITLLWQTMKNRQQTQHWLVSEVMPIVSKVQLKKELLLPAVCMKKVKLKITLQ